MPRATAPPCLSLATCHRLTLPQVGRPGDGQPLHSVPLAFGSLSWLDATVSREPSGLRTYSAPSILTGLEEPSSARTPLGPTGATARCVASSSSQLRLPSCFAAEPMHAHTAWPAPMFISVQGQRGRRTAFRSTNCVCSDGCPFLAPGPVSCYEYSYMK